ncbi:MAG TPA: isochorismatase family protein [Desulfobacterales bacterium]|nr:isochorismatase family protein [Desulfobacterales bacterium]
MATGKKHNPLCGRRVAAHFCVLTTALDAICHDFKAVLLEDCSASFSKNLHRQTIATYRQIPFTLC